MGRRWHGFALDASRRWFAAGNTRGAAEEIAPVFHLQALGAQQVGEGPGVAEVGAVGADHGEVLGTPQQEALDQRQDHLQMEEVDGSQNPALGVGGLDHGEYAIRS